MAIAMKGLRPKPEYEDLIGVAVSGKLYNVKFPNRGAKFLWGRHEGDEKKARTSKQTII